MHFPFDLRPFWCYRINSFVKDVGGRLSNGANDDAETNTFNWKFQY
jgi:hypothetical protein